MKFTGGGNVQFNHTAHNTCVYRASYEIAFVIYNNKNRVQFRTLQ